MKLYEISQSVNNNYDTYDSAIVAAESEDEARMINPDKMDDEDWDGEVGSWSAWCAAKDVDVEYIGEAKEGTKKGLILASFNAG